jgi:hypothetical protein
MFIFQSNERDRPFPTIQVYRILELSSTCVAGYYRYICNLEGDALSSLDILHSHHFLWLYHAVYHTVSPVCLLFCFSCKVKSLCTAKTDPWLSFNDQSSWSTIHTCINYKSYYVYIYTEICSYIISASRVETSTNGAAWYLYTMLKTQPPESLGILRLPDGTAVVSSCSSRVRISCILLVFVPITCWLKVHLCDFVQSQPLRWSILCVQAEKLPTYKSCYNVAWDIWLQI